MKANRAMRRAEEAVSPVIGSILLISIVVVMAGAVVFIVQVFAEQDTTEHPDLTFIKHNEDRRLTVADITWAGSTLYWSNTTASADYITVTGCTSVNGQDFNGTVPVTIGDELLCDAGQVIMVFALDDFTIYTTIFQ